MSPIPCGGTSGTPRWRWQARCSRCSSAPTWATVKVNPWMFRAFVARPLAESAAALALAGLVLVFVGLRRGRNLLPFLGSSGLIVGLLVATAASVFPVMLRATGGEALWITAY